MKKIIQLFSGIMLVCGYLHAQSVNARLDINQGILNGTITATSTTIDFGYLSSVFDNNIGTLARSGNINPMIITLVFNSPVNLTSSNVFSATDGLWTVEGAATLTDLDNGTGTYTKLVDQSATLANTTVSKTFTAYSAKVVRLKVYRTDGDNYVHLYEWQLFATQTVTSLSVVKDPYFVFKNATQIVISPLQKVKLKINGFTSTGGAAEITNATFASANTNVATVSNTGVVTGVGVGTTTITVSLGTVKTLLTVTVQNDPNGSDFSIQYIKRRPQINYVVNSANPKVDGWPVANSNVTWRAYVKSWFPVAKNNVSYKWLINGTVVASGTVNIPARGIAKVDFVRPWTFTREELTFVIDANNTVPEVVETNNQLKTYTDAITINLYVEESLYEYFHKYQRSVNAPEKTNSYEDWLQIRTVKRWNEVLCPSAIYPETPNGVLDRMRVDSIILVADNALPLVPGAGANDPNANDMSVDLKWASITSGLGSSFTDSERNYYRDTLTGDDSNPFFYDGALLHEVGHARYLIDEYGSDLHDNDPRVIEIEENGKRIAGDPFYMPHLGNSVMVYTSQQLGLMNGQYTYIDRHSAGALNQIAGRRAVSGNTNPPGNGGVFMEDLPSQNRFTVKDAQGNLLRNASIKIYQNTQGELSKHYDNIPEYTLVTDNNGQVLVGKNPFQTDGFIGNATRGLIIIRVETSTQVGYTFFESSWFNLAYWRGEKTLANYDLVFDKLVTKTAIGISGPACVLSGQGNIFTVNPEFSNFTNIYWWMDGDGYTTQNTYNPTVAQFVFSQYNTTGKVHVGITYPTSPWYVTYEKSILVNSCTSARKESSVETTDVILPSSIRVINTQGVEVAKGESEDARLYFNAQNLPSGLYILQVESPTGPYILKAIK